MARSQVAQSTASARRAEIVATARRLYEEKGLARTTVKDITESIGVTRSLFYHYFPDKESVTEAVLDDYVNEFKEMVELWAESNDPLNTRKALRECISMLKRGVFDSDSFRNSLARSENASLYMQFLSQSADMLARYFTDVVAPEYAKYHELHIENLYDVLFMLTIGMVGYVRNHPDASDELLESILAQVLNLDLDNAALKTSSHA